MSTEQPNLVGRDPDAPPRTRRALDQLKDRINSLQRQGILVQAGDTEWTLDVSSLVNATSGGAALLFDNEGEESFPIPGPQGVQGFIGPTGPQGLQGQPGVTFAPDADQGEEGMPVPGPVGPTGATGSTGSIGPQGIQGLPGPTLLMESDQGEEGMPIPGPVGPQGSTGSTGLTGLQGLPGPSMFLEPEQGEEGMPIPGSPGQQGATGSTGSAGSQGIQGVPGSTIFLEPDTGEEGMPIPGHAGATGATGSTGSAGSQGIQGLPGPALLLEGDQEEYAWWLGAGNDSDLVHRYRSETISGQKTFAATQLFQGPTLLQQQLGDGGNWYKIGRSTSTGFMANAGTQDGFIGWLFDGTGGGTGNATVPLTLKNGTDGSVNSAQFQAQNSAGNLAYQGVTAPSYSSFTPLNSGAAFWISFGVPAIYGAQDSQQIKFTQNAVIIATVSTGGNWSFAGHLSTTGTTPSIASGTAAGTTPTVSVTGNDQRGIVSVTLGTAPPIGGGTLFTVTFAVAWVAAPYVVTCPANTAAATYSALNVMPQASVTTTTFIMTSTGLTGPGAGTVLAWNYHCIG